VSGRRDGSSSSGRPLGSLSSSLAPGPYAGLLELSRDAIESKVTRGGRGRQDGVGCSRVTAERVRHSWTYRGQKRMGSCWARWPGVPETAARLRGGGRDGRVRCPWPGRAGPRCAREIGDRGRCQFGGRVADTDRGSCSGPARSGRQLSGWLRLSRGGEVMLRWWWAARMPDEAGAPGGPEALAGASSFGGWRWLEIGAGRWVVVGEGRTAKGRVEDDNAMPYRFCVVRHVAFFVA